MDSCTWKRAHAYAGQDKGASHEVIFLAERPSRGNFFPFTAGFRRRWTEIAATGHDRVSTGTAGWADHLFGRTGQRHENRRNQQSGSADQGKSVDFSSRLQTDFTSQKRADTDNEGATASEEITRTG